MIGALALLLVLGLAAPVAWIALGGPWLLLVPSLAGAGLVAYGLGWPGPIEFPGGLGEAAPLVAGGLFALLLVGDAAGRNPLFPTVGDEGPTMGVLGMVVQASALLLSLSLGRRRARIDGRHIATVAGTFLVAPWLFALVWRWMDAGMLGFPLVDELEGASLALGFAVFAVVFLRFVGARVPLGVRRLAGPVLGVGLVAFDLWTRGLLFGITLPAMAIVFPAIRELWIGVDRPGSKDHG